MTRPTDDLRVRAQLGVRCKTSTVRNILAWTKE